jgi:toluene monooxygenase system ferredoxin subunit
VIDSAVLNKFPLFQDISPTILSKIASISEEITLKEGDVVFREGQTADKLHFLIKGGIALRVNIMSKPDSVTVSYVAKGNQCFGWSGIVPPYHYTATAHCEEDSRIVAVQGDEFMKIISENPADGFKVMQRVAEIISDRLRNSRQALLKTL